MQTHYFANNDSSSQSNGFSNSHVWVWELDHKESWAPKNWCFWTVVLEKTLESPLDSKEIQSVHPTGDQSWIFIGRTDTEAKTSILWPPDAKNWLTGKDPDAGKIEGGRRRGQQRMRWLDGITDSKDVSLSKLREWWWTGRPGVLQSMGLQRVRHNWATKHYTRKNCLVTWSCLTLWPHGLPCARLLCPPLSPGICSNSCPLSCWCYLTISSSSIPIAFCFSLSQKQGLFQWVGSFHQAAKVLELQLQHQSFQWIFRVDFF